MPTRIEVFFSYAEKDEDLYKQLESHLSILRQQGLIVGWHRHNIRAGMDRLSEINSHLNSAQIIVLLISSHFFNSEECSDIEMKRAMQRYETGDARVIPVLLRPVDYRGASFDKLSVLPKNKVPVTSWPDRDKAFLSIAQDLRAVVDDIAKKSSPPVSISRLSEQREEIKQTVTHTGLHHLSPINASLLSRNHDGKSFDAFLSHSPTDVEWVEKNLAQRLTDDYGLRVWLDRWELIPGEPWQPAIARGLDQAQSCVVCIGEHVSHGWFQLVIQTAKNRQAYDPSFRVIPVFLPSAKNFSLDNFLELNTWIDFRIPDQLYAYHLLVCGIKGIAPGRWPSK